MLNQETTIILLVWIVLIILIILLNNYRIKRQYKKNTKGLQYIINETVYQDMVNIGFYNTITQETEWILQVSHNQENKPMLLKKLYVNDMNTLNDVIQSYSSIAQVQLHNHKELERYNTLLNSYKLS